MIHSSQQEQYPQIFHNDSSLLLNSEQMIIGDYLLGETIGKGTFGKVKLATHLPTREKVAVKILEKKMIQGAQDQESIDSEISILKKLIHPNISQLYEIVETQDCHYLIIEYAENGELFDLIVKKRRLTDQEACLVFAQILNALEYLHEMNICHRDLKPENLLFNKNYELKLVDFGLSKQCFYGSQQQLYTCCGSPCYASPETISSQPYIGKYVDMWSCGIILFAMVCGYLPFDDDNQTALFQKIIKCEYYIPKDISPEAAFVIRGLLQKDPNNRMTIQDIKQTPFYTQIMTGSFVQPGIRIGIDPIPIDPAIIEILEREGIDRNTIIFSISQNLYDSISATYYLLRQQANRYHFSLYYNNNPAISQKIENDARALHRQYLKVKEDIVEQMSVLNNCQLEIEQGRQIFIHNQGENIEEVNKVVGSTSKNSNDFDSIISNFQSQQLINSYCNQSINQANQVENPYRVNIDLLNDLEWGEQAVDSLPQDIINQKKQKKQVIITNQIMQLVIQQNQQNLSPDHNSQKLLSPHFNVVKGQIPLDYPVNKQYVSEKGSKNNNKKQGKVLVLDYNQPNHGSEACIDSSSTSSGDTPFEKKKPEIKKKVDVPAQVSKMNKSIPQKKLKKSGFYEKTLDFERSDVDNQQFSSPTNQFNLKRQSLPFFLNSNQFSGNKPSSTQQIKLTNLIKQENKNSQTQINNNIHTQIELNDSAKIEEWKDKFHNSKENNKNQSCENPIMNNFLKKNNSNQLTPSLKKSNANQIRTLTFNSFIHNQAKELNLKNIKSPSSQKYIEVIKCNQSITTSLPETATSTFESQKQHEDYLFINGCSGIESATSINLNLHGPSQSADDHISILEMHDCVIGDSPLNKQIISSQQHKKIEPLIINKNDLCNLKRTATNNINSYFSPSKLKQNFTDTCIPSPNQQPLIQKCLGSSQNKQEKQIPSSKNIQIPSSKNIEIPSSKNIEIPSNNEKEQPLNSKSQNQIISDYQRHEMIKEIVHSPKGSASISQLKERNASKEQQKSKETMNTSSKDIKSEAQKQMKNLFFKNDYSKSKSNVNNITHNAKMNYYHLSHNSTQINSTNKPNLNKSLFSQQSPQPQKKNQGQQSIQSRTGNLKANKSALINLSNSIDHNYSSNSNNKMKHTTMESKRPSSIGDCCAWNQIKKNEQEQISSPTSHQKQLIQQKLSNICKSIIPSSPTQQAKGDCKDILNVRSSNKSINFLHGSLKKLESFELYSPLSKDIKDPKYPSEMNKKNSDNTYSSRDSKRNSLPKPIINSPINKNVKQFSHKISLDNLMFRQSTTTQDCIQFYSPKNKQNSTPFIESTSESSFTLFKKMTKQMQTPKLSSPQVKSPSQIDQKQNSNRDNKLNISSSQSNKGQEMKNIHKLNSSTFSSQLNCIFLDQKKNQ